MPRYDLRPCPFCGDTAMIHKNCGRRGGFVYVKCDFCGAQTKPFSVPDITLYNSADVWESESVRKAVKFWNRRGEEK